MTEFIVAEISKNWERWHMAGAAFCPTNFIREPVRDERAAGAAPAAEPVPEKIAGPSSSGSGA